MKKTKDLNEMRLKSTSPDDFAKLLEEYAKSNKEEMSISFMGLYANQSASNSHSCPIGDNFNENWNRETNRPLGYPALVGKVVMKKKKETGKYCLDALTRNLFNEIPGLCIGSGGGGYVSQYGVTLWLADFPLWGNKVLKIFDIQEKLNRVESVNEKNKENISSLINSAINENCEIKMFSEKIDKLKTDIINEITKSHPELVELDTLDFKKQLHDLKNELGINN